MNSFLIVIELLIVCVCIRLLIGNLHSWLNFRKCNENMSHIKPIQCEARNENPLETNNIEYNNSLINVMWLSTSPDGFI